MKVVVCMVVGIILAAPFGVLAQANPIGTLDATGVIQPGTGSPEGGSIGADQMVEKVIAIINWFAWFVALMAVVMGLYAGFLFITARGESSQLTTARETLVWAVIGVAVAVVAFSIIILTKTIFDLE